MIVKDILFNPSKAFKEIEKEKLQQTLGWLFLSAFIYAVGNGIVVLFINPLHPLASYFSIILSFIRGIFSPLVLTIPLHVLVYIFGGRKGIKQTLKATIYAFIPYLLFGWIPLLNFVFMFWGCIILIIGIKELQKISIIDAILIWLILGFIFYIFYLMKIAQSHIIL